MKTEFETLFIQKAIEAYHTEHRNLIESTKRQFASMFGIIPDNVEVGIVYVDDMKFEFVSEYGPFSKRDFWKVSRKCSKCGNWYCVDDKVSTLREVGSILLLSALCEKHRKK